VGGAGAGGVKKAQRARRSASGVGWPPRAPFFFDVGGVGGVAGVAGGSAKYFLSSCSHFLVRSASSSGAGGFKDADAGGVAGIGVGVVWIGVGWIVDVAVELMVVAVLGAGVDVATAGAEVEHSGVGVAGVGVGARSDADAIGRRLPQSSHQWRVFELSKVQALHDQSAASGVGVGVGVAFVGVAVVGQGGVGWLATGSRLGVATLVCVAIDVLTAVTVQVGGGFDGVATLIEAASDLGGVATLAAGAVGWTLGGVNVFGRAPPWPWPASDADVGVVSTCGAGVVFGVDAKTAAADGERRTATGEAAGVAVGDAGEDAGGDADADTDADAGAVHTNDGLTVVRILLNELNMRISWRADGFGVVSPPASSTGRRRGRAPVAAASASASASPE